MQTVHSHDARIPALGFGTFELSSEAARDRVAEALDLGYRHVDTARAYRNEDGVGEGVRKSSVPRDQVFVTSKVWQDDFRPEDLAKSVRASLKKTGLDHLDLMLLHWPNPDVPIADSLGALEDARREGLIRYYGVSNFTRALFEEAVAASPSPLVTNQVELHPLIDQTRVREAARRHGTALTAYCPLAQGRVVDEPELVRIAAEHHATPAQVALAWLLADGATVAIPRSSKPHRIRENHEALAVRLSDEERAAIDTLRSRHERVIDPSFAPDWDPPGSD